MVLTDITKDFDPERDQDVNPLLWEIRRERRVELMGEGTRLDDLRRWKKGHYVNKQPTGVYLKDASEFNVKVLNGPSNNEGYVYYFEKPIGWLEHYYLNPIPLTQGAYRLPSRIERSFSLSVKIQTEKRRQALKCLKTKCILTA